MNRTPDDPHELTLATLGIASAEFNVLADARARYEEELLEAKEPMAEFFAATMLVQPLMWQEDLAWDFLDNVWESKPEGFEEIILRGRAFLDTTIARREAVSEQSVRASQELTPTMSQHAIAYMDEQWVPLRQRLPSVDSKLRENQFPRTGVWRPAEKLAFETRLQALALAPAKDAFVPLSGRLLQELDYDVVPLSVFTGRSSETAAPVLVAVTNDLWLVQNGAGGPEINRSGLDEVSLVDRKKRFGRDVIVLEIQGHEAIYEGLQPAEEVALLRDFLALGPQGRQMVSAVRSKVLEQQLEQQRAPLARFGNLALYPGLLATPEGNFAISPTVKAEVESAGNMSFTRRPTLSRAIAGGLLLGPLGALGATVFAPKATSHDGRELYMFVEGPDFYYGHGASPNDGLALREFAAAVNLAARQSSPPDP